MFAAGPGAGPAGGGVGGRHGLRRDPPDHHPDRAEERAPPRMPARVHRLRALCGSQGLGGRADAARAERGRSVRAASKLRGPHKFFLKEPLIPASANKGLFLLAPLIFAALSLAGWAVIPLAQGWAIADINVGILYLFAISSLTVYGVIMGGWASELEICLPRRAEIGRPDGVLRSLDRVRVRDRADVRRLAQPHRHRRRAGYPDRNLRLVLAVAVPDVRGVLHLGDGRDDRPPFDLPKPSRSSSPGTWSNIRRPRS